MVFPSAVIPLTAACKLAAFGTGGWRAAIVRRVDVFVARFAKGNVSRVWLVEREVGEVKIVCGRLGLLMQTRQTFCAAKDREMKGMGTTARVIL